MPVAGSRQVQVCKDEREEAERKRCWSHNPAGARPDLNRTSSCFPTLSFFIFFLFLSEPPLLLSQRRLQHPGSAKMKMSFQLPLVKLGRVQSFTATCSSTPVPSRRDPFVHNSRSTLNLVWRVATILRQRAGFRIYARDVRFAINVVFKIALKCGPSGWRCVCAHLPLSLLYTSSSRGQHAHTRTRARAPRCKPAL